MPLSNPVKYEKFNALRKLLVAVSHEHLIAGNHLLHQLSFRSTLARGNRLRNRDTSQSKSLLE